MALQIPPMAQADTQYYKTCHLLGFVPLECTHILLHRVYQMTWHLRERCR